MRSFLSPRSHKSPSSSSSPAPNRHVPSIAVHEPADVTRRSDSGGGGGGMAFVSKSRKVRFDLHLRILDLNNVPLVSGTSFIKWHLPSSTAAEHRGRTNKCAIREHRVAYEYEKRLPVRLTVGKDGMLQECPVEFEILQEYSAGGRGERIELGNVRLNLAEYVDPADPTSPSAVPREESAEDGGIVRRYLMQDSKINSTLKLGIHMRYVEGSREYYAPALRTAPVFGGIAGIISSSDPVATPNNNAGSNEDGGAGGQDTLPNLSIRNKELGEMQDMYRRTLAAFWASQPGELKADECIEDIFAGGDGWGSRFHEASTNNNNASRNTDNAHSNSRRRHSRDRANSTAGDGAGSGASTPRARDVGGAEVTGRGEGRMYAQGKGMLAMGRQSRHSKNFRGVRRGQGEVDEFEVREDLRSWRVGEAAAR